MESVREGCCVDDERLERISRDGVARREASIVDGSDNALLDIGGNDCDGGFWRRESHSWRSVFSLGRKSC